METHFKEDLFMSFDIEADGPTPMVNNLLSIGIVGITMDKEIVFTYEANIEPLASHVPDEKCMQTFWLKPEQKLAWDRLQVNKRNYVTVFEELGSQLKELNATYNLRFVAFPACFDWMFLKCYYELAKANSESKERFHDIGFLCECASTLWDVYKEKNNLTSTTFAGDLFKRWGEFDEKTNHMALSDAIVQGKFYVTLLKQLNIKLFE